MMNAVSVRASIQDTTPSLRSPHRAHSHRPKRVRSSQRGQATTEFAVLALVLVPLAIAVPLMGKYIDLMQAAEQASRYVAFEAAARNSSSFWKSDVELASEVRRRFFSATSAPLKTGDVVGDFSAFHNPVWNSPSGKPLLDNFDASVSVQGQVSGLNAVPGTVLYRSELDLPNDNLYSATVTLKLADIAGFSPLDKIGLTTSRKTVLLTDAWTARNDKTIRDKIEDSMVMYPHGKLKALIDPVGMAPTVVFDPALKVSDFDWDVVPCDRLVGGCP